MMDPTFIIGLAENIVQVVDFTCRVLHHGRTLYNFRSGALLIMTSYEEIRKPCSDLKRSRFSSGPCVAFSVRSNPTMQS